MAEEEMVLAWALVVEFLGGLGVEEPKEEVPLRLRTEEPNRWRGVLHACVYTWRHRRRCTGGAVMEGQ